MSRNEYSCDCNVIHDDVVNYVTKEMLDDDTYFKAAMFFKVLGDNTRIHIIGALSKHEMCVCDLANILSMTKSAVSHQLGRLRDTHLVKFRRDGKTVYYSLDDNHVRSMLASALEHVND